MEWNRTYYIIIPLLFKESPHSTSRKERGSSMTEEQTKKARGSRGEFLSLSGPQMKVPLMSYKVMNYCVLEDRGAFNCK